MSKAQQRRFYNNADEHQQAIVRIVREISRTHGIERVWADLMEMGAIALARLDSRQAQAREAQYLRVVERYSADQVQLMAQAFAHIVMAFEARMSVEDDGQSLKVRLSDVLGQTYMMFELGNSGTGQFFTPYEVSLLMARMLVEPSVDLIERQKFVRLSEPACGAGSMIIAYAQCLHEADVNYQQRMHVHAIDVDIRCVHMAYIQFSLLHIPAVVVHGNALSGEAWSHWYTPAHIIGGWDRKLRQREALEAMRTLLAGGDETPERDACPAPALTSGRGASQMQLF